MTAAIPADAGLALERTALSWRRTALSAAVAALVLTHAAALTPQRPIAVSAIGVAIALAALAAACYRRNRVLRARRHHAIDRTTAAVATVVTTVAGITALIGASW